MSKTTRRRFSSAFKTKVCLEALKERETIEALAKKYDIHPNQINTWKREFISKSETVFEKSTDPGRESKVNASPCTRSLPSGFLPSTPASGRTD